MAQLGRWTKSCISKQYWSRCGPTYHWPSLVWASVSSCKVVRQVVRTVGNHFLEDKFPFCLPLPFFQHESLQEILISCGFIVSTATNRGKWKKVLIYCGKEHWEEQSSMVPISLARQSHNLCGISFWEGSYYFGSYQVPSPSMRSLEKFSCHRVFQNSHSQQKSTSVSEHLYSCKHIYTYTPMEAKPIKWKSSSETWLGKTRS